MNSYWRWSEAISGLESNSLSDPHPQTNPHSPSHVSAFGIFSHAIPRFVILAKNSSVLNLIETAQHLDTNKQNELMRLVSGCH